MFKILFIMIVFTQLVTAGDKQMSIYDFEVETIAGEKITLSKYKGKVLLIVNVASKCGFTPQYKGLQKLYKSYHDSGLEILGFPCNQFREQEPADEKAIQSFCTLNYGVEFPMFSKIKVNGEETHPLYQYLKSVQAGFLGTESIKWNFTKFLVDREGHVVARFGSTTKPSEIEEDIKKLL
jgi:glutathione peroxidase